MNTKRVFIEKKEEFNTEADNLFRDLKNYLGVKSLQKVRVVNAYDIINAKNEEYNQIVGNILREKNLDYLYETTLPVKDEEKLFRTEFVPGQYNQREDSVNQTIYILLNKKDIKVKHSKIIILEGVDNQELNLIKDYYINPVEMREIDMDFIHYEEYEEVEKEIEAIEDFVNMTEKEMGTMKEKYGLGLDMEDLLFTQKYFKEKEKRNPTITELKVIDTYWSDHCRHTTFMTEIENIKLEEGKYKPLIEKAFEEYLSSRNYVYPNSERPISLMDLATINMKEIKKKGLLEDLEESEEINAASVEIDVDINGKIKRWLLMFKNETHNHPTEIEPFGGASTCLGGCIRDPLSGRAYVYQAMRITGASDPRQSFEDTLPGKLPQRKITQSAMEGYSSYGNQIGVPAGYVEEIYHEGYRAKRMEVGALVAAAPRENVIRKSPQTGDLILLVGGRTGKDGLGGAVGSSKKHTEESLETGGAEVQKGNPPLERKILRLFRNKDLSQMIKKCNDFGAGGVSVAIGELAPGLKIDLDKVPLKYPGLDGTEIALSESQERMAVVIEKGNLESFIKYAEEEDLETTVVAIVTSDNRLFMNWKGNPIVNISREFLDTNGIRKKTKVLIEKPNEDNYLHHAPNYIDEKGLEENWIKNLTCLNHSSQKGLIEKFDHSVGAGTVLMPLGGKHKLTTTEGMAAKIPVLEGETNTCSLMTYGFDPNLSKWSPYHGGIYAVIESLAKITAMGGDFRKVRLTFQEYFERLGTEDVKWGKPFAALLGAFIVEKELNIPSIGGKDSMSGTFEDIDVPPTIISFAVTADKVQNIISPEFKDVNNNVVLIPLNIDDEGMVDFKQLKTNYTRIKELIDDGKIISASAVKSGGIARSISEMAFGNKIGFKFVEGYDEKNLFLPLYGSIVVEIKENPENLLKGVEYRLLGTTIEDECIEISKERLDLNHLIEEWTKPLMDVFPIDDRKLYKPRKILYNKEMIKKSNIKIAKPKVFIPVFTGTYGEYDMGKSFEEAGAIVDTFVFRTLDNEAIDYSFKEIAKRIKECQIIGLPDGSVLGDEPEGGGKLLANILKNPYVKEALMELIKDKDGLILGIGNGCAGLIKSGLLPYGEIKDLDEDSINITYNSSGYHISTIAKIKVASNLSPWFNNRKVGDIQSLPLSTKEGRIVGKQKTIKVLMDKGQIATQYLDQNPTGSIYGIEGITSPDGRILGRVANCDRVGKGLYKNVEKMEEERLFKAGVSYFG
ncbi:phosphoribosylformylglycinamidine synthase [Schnuerera sp.]|uniref:phosphoribosylformylglycinamidine synthase n=1 Tax=Schnuerera sp. TaxID=2794844 RepID=UPI002C714043|nr:phosphoribosylformylglycinamidine synthase [Schnuerera sp.]HSH36766.1 phosphoribosylformylglycinamidine synthase [Schnuerera sp.]